MSARDRKQELLDSEPAAARAQRGGTLRGAGTKRDIPNARMLAPAHVNPVHAAHHWEQRLVQERKSAAEWKASWGFLEAEKPISEVLANVWDEANHSKLGPMHEFLAQTHRAKQAKLQGDATLSLASTARTPTSGRAPEPFASPVSSPTGKGASARPYTPTTPSSAARLAAAQNADANAGVSAVDKLPPLHLDAKTAAVLRPQLQQYTGASALTVGVDPIRKYRFPQTAAQMVGWQTAKRIQLLREAEAAAAAADGADGTTAGSGGFGATGAGATLSASASGGSLTATQRSALSATGGGGGSTTRRTGARGYPPPSEAVQQLGLLSQSTALAATARPRATQRGVGANGGPTATLHTGGGAWARAGLVTPAAAALYGTHAVQPGVAHPSGKMDHTAFWNHGLHNHNQAFWN